MPPDPWSLGVPPASATPPRFLDLSGSESPLGCSPLVNRAVAASLARSDAPRGEAVDRLREALARRHNVPAHRILLGAGTRALLPALLAGLGESGAALALPAAAPPLHVLAAARGGRAVIPVADWRQAEAWDAAGRAGARLGLLCHPHNPTGAFLSREEMVSLRAAARRQDMLLVVDEAFAEVADAEAFPRAAALLDEAPGLVVTRTLSCVHGLGGLPVACALLSEAAARTLEAAGAGIGIAPGDVAAEAAEAALEDAAFTSMVVERACRARFRLRRALEDAGVEARAGQGPWVMVRAAGDACRRLAARGVRVRDLAPWGHPEWLRVRTGTDADAAAFLDAAKGIVT